MSHLRLDFSGTSLLPSSAFTIKIGGQHRWQVFQSPKKSFTSDPRACLLCGGISGYCCLCWGCTLEGPWAPQSTLPYPAFPVGTEKETLAGQTPWMCRNPTAQARESRVGCQCRIWESQIHIQALLSTP